MSDPKASPNDANVWGSVPAGDDEWLGQDGIKAEHDRVVKMLNDAAAKRVAAAARPVPAGDERERLTRWMHDAIVLTGMGSCVHSPENEWAPWCDVLARRLIAAGVSTGDATTPEPDRLREAAQAYLAAFDMPLSTDPEVHYDTLTAAREALRAALSRPPESGPFTREAVDWHDAAHPDHAAGTSLSCADCVPFLRPPESGTPKEPTDG